MRNSASSLLGLLGLLLLTVATEAAECRVRHPVVLLPGIMGTVLDGEGKNIPDLPSSCASSFSHRRLWVAVTEFIKFGCWERYLWLHWNNASWRGTEGVETDIPDWGKLLPVDNLDPALVWEWFNNGGFHTLAKHCAKERGYTLDGDVVSAPYDWRYAPAEAWAERVRLHVENVSAANGGRKVVLHGHSLGTLYGYYFLASMQPQWKAKYVHRFIASSPVWGGASEAIGAMFEGFNFGTPLDGSFLAPVARRLESEWLLLPGGGAWASGAVAVSTPSRNYTFSEILDVLKAMGPELDAAGKWRKSRESLTQFDDFAALPQVPVSCFYTTGKKTLHALHFAEDMSSHDPDGKWPQPKSLEHGDGDGTVPVESSIYACNRWAAAGADVKITHIPGYSHNGILHAQEFVNAVLDLYCEN